MKVTPGSNEPEIIAGNLFAPYGVALTKNAAYISIGTVAEGVGEVIKIPLD